MTSRLPWAALLLSACTIPDPDPVPLPPPQLVRLETVVRPDVLAVVDFSDERPEMERSEGSLVDNFIDSEFLPPGHYWRMRSEHGNTLPDAVVDGREVFVRLTGDGAFLWYEFPPVRPGAPRRVATAKGVSDYFALALEQRGIAGRILRVASVEEARAVGADLVLTGQLDHLSGGMSEVHQGIEQRPDDRCEHLLFSRVGMRLRLDRVLDDHLLWETTLTDPLSSEDPQHLFDLTEDFRGVATGVGGPRLLRLDQEHHPALAYSDMVNHVERRLRHAAITSVMDIESALRLNLPID